MQQDNQSSGTPQENQNQNQNENQNQEQQDQFPLTKIQIEEKNAAEIRPFREPASSEANPGKGETHIV